MTVEIHLDRRKRGSRQVWRLWWREAGRKRTLERAAWTRADAQAEAERMRRAWADRGRIVAWPEFEKRYLADQVRRNRPTTVADAKTVIRRFRRIMAPETLNEVTRESMAAYMAGGMGAGVVPAGREAPILPLRPASENKHLRTLRAAMEWAKAVGLVPETWRNPCDGLKRVKEIRLPHAILETADQCRRLVDELHKDGIEWEAAVRLGLECGLRVGEISHIAWKAIDLERGEVRIQPQADGWTPKGMSGVMGLGKTLRAVLADMRMQAEKRLETGDWRPEVQRAVPTASSLQPQAYLQPQASRVMRAVSAAAFEKAFRKRLRAACIRAGLPDVPPHGLRRSFGTRLANEGMDANRLRQVMRHDDLRTTSKYYLQVDERRAAEEARRLIEEAV